MHYVFGDELDDACKRYREAKPAQPGELTVVQCLRGSIIIIGDNIQFVETMIHLVEHRRSKNFIEVPLTELGVLFYALRLNHIQFRILSP